MRFIRLNPFLIFPLLVFGMIVIYGCKERTINTFEEDAGFYSVYGALDAESDLNFIRIKNAQTPVALDSLNPFNGTVTIESLENETTAVLNDTIIDFSGYPTHNFILRENLQPKNSYRLTVTGPGGKSVSSTATVPGITDASVTPSENIFCHQQLEFSFKNVVYPEHVRMEVGFGSNEIDWAEIGIVDQLRHRDDRNEMYVEMSILNLLVEVYPPNPSINNRNTNPRNLRSNVECNDVSQLHVRYTHYGPEWEILESGRFPVDPLQWQDVDKGLGFLGAFRQNTFTIPF